MSVENLRYSKNKSEHPDILFNAKDFYLIGIVSRQKDLIIDMFWSQSTNLSLELIKLFVFSG